MKILKYLQSHLNIKLLVSFFIIILVLSLVLIAAVELVMPRAFQGHLNFMNDLLEDENPILTQHELNLFDSFRRAIYSALSFALPAALISALVLSIAFSNQFVKPIKDLSEASRKISQGKYDQRILLPNKIGIDEMDELQHLAINFNQMASKLEKTEDLRRQLIGDVSHELRTPISLIKVSMEGLIDGIVRPSKKLFYQVQIEADRLSKLVNDLQELSIIESGAYKLNKEEFNINTVITSVVENLSPQYSRKNIRVILDFQKRKVQESFDIDRIKQVLTNILANAYQYSPKGGTVTIKISADKKYIHVSITDEGRGISREDLPHIFTRFFRADKSRTRNSGGSGIGLTITKQLVEAHGGSINIYSKGIDKGTTVSFTLPID